jgi:hypothetical protein
LLKDIVKLKQFHGKPNEIPNESITPSNSVKPRSFLEVGSDFLWSKFKTKDLRTQDRLKNQTHPKLETEQQYKKPLKALKYLSALMELVVI